MNCKILTSGSYLPSKIVTNDDLSLTLNTSDQWIKDRTGITKRYIAEDETVSDLATKAALNALSRLSYNHNLIDLIIVATTTSESIFPSIATKVQNMLKLNDIAAAFDIQAVCGGFIYGLHLANSLIESGANKNILLIGAEKMSSILDWTDRSTAILFGDGAGAFVLSASDDDSCIIDSKIYSNGAYSNILYTESKDDNDGKQQYIKMRGSELFKLAIENMSKSCIEILKNNNMTADDIDFFLPHQANARIIDQLSKIIGISDEKVIKTTDIHANCSAASIPLAFDHMLSLNKIKRGDLILSTAVGAGLTWGSCLFRF